MKNNKAVAAVAAGIGAFICTLISVTEFLTSDGSGKSSAVKRRGKGYSAIFIRGGKSRRKCIYSAAAAFLSAAAGLLYALHCYGGREKK